MNLRFLSFQRSIVSVRLPSRRTCLALGTDFSYCRSLRRGKIHKGSSGEAQEAPADSWALLDLQVSMPDEEVDLGAFYTLFFEVTGEVFDDGYRAVAASGAAYA